MPLAILRTMDTSLAESHRAAALWCSITSSVPRGQYSMMRYTSLPCWERPLNPTMLSWDPALCDNSQTLVLIAQRTAMSGHSI